MHEHNLFRSMLERREKIYEGELAACPSRQGKNGYLLVTHVLYIHLSTK